MTERLPHNVRCLLAARATRSIGQGATVASFSLYLHALGFGGTAIGVILMAGLAFGALLTLIIGPLSDRLSRRRLLIGYELAAAAAALAAIVTPNEAVLIAAATLAGFGRGANGAAGPFSPVEQAWLAREVEGDARRRALSHNATLGFLGMGAGALLVAVPPLLGFGYPALESFRILFTLPLAGSLASLALIAWTRESSTPRAAPAHDHRTEARIKRDENRRIGKLALTGAINGLAIGIIGPLIAYWFLRRYAHGPAAIGPALAAGFALAALGAMLASWLGRRVGPVRAVIAMRIVGLALLLGIPFSPDFALAATLYALRGIFNRGTAGVRQAVAASLTRAERRGVAASVQNLSVQIPRSIGPVLGGWLIHRGDFTAPFLIAAALQGLYIVLYQRFFGSLDPSSGPETATSNDPAL
ncbi:MAG: MFS transporter [Steroidobacteraceae bacterium]